MKPKVDKSSYIDPAAAVIGNVKIERNCGVFPNVVIRADQNMIEIKEGSNIQDGSVIHTDEIHKVKIGKNVSIGHAAVVHGATIEENCIIGMNSTVLNGAKIGKGSIIGANAIVTEDKEIPENSLVIGIPGKVVKNDKKYSEMGKKNAEKYQKLSQEYKNGKYFRLWKIKKFFYDFLSFSRV